MARLVSLLFVVAAACAQADVIWLRNDEDIVKSVGNKLEKPLRLFKGKRGPDEMHYLRGRIVDVDVASVGKERILVEPWSRKSSTSRELVVGKQIWVKIGGKNREVQDVVHEFDSYLDIEFMFSSRKNFGSQRWKERVRLLLDPKGDFGLVAGSALPPKETTQERNEVRLEGWLPFLLKDLVSTPPESAMAAPEEGETHEEMRARMEKAKPSQDLQLYRPAFHPIRHVQTPEQAVRTLLSGAALAGSHRKQLAKELDQRYPDPKDRSELDFATQCRFAVGFLCALSKVPARPALDADGKPLKYPYKDWAKRHYRELGRAARRELITILEQAAPGTASKYDHFRDDALSEVEDMLAKLPDDVRQRVAPRYQSLLASKGGKARLNKRSRLDPTPSELALQALRVIRNYPTWWVIQLNADDPGEGVDPRWKALADDPNALPPTAESDRLITALIRLSQASTGVDGYPTDPSDSPLPDPRRLDGQDLRDEVQLMAEATLSGLLLPSAPDTGSADWRMPLDKLSPALADMATQSARAFRLALEPLYYSENPAVQEVLTRPLVAVVGRLDAFLFPEVLDNLFSTLNHEIKPDPTASKFDVRRERAKRAFAARLILILASQGGDKEGLGLEGDRIQKFGNTTITRLLGLRVARATGEISPGERRLDDAIRKASEGSSPLGERARRTEEQIEVQRAKAELELREELAKAREAYSAAKAALDTAPPKLEALKREALEVELARTKREHEEIAAKLKGMLSAKR